ncbi:nucleolar transcription factor 1-like [Papaver somniferum]|uniref:nucleolar transcription factor 1-like n=1 Tax=Papaver somniferum TaxID=3469 RepID=UPI000E6F7BB7|nr:nucleolar transcription factor 1-like [Papaver somniferum]
MFYLLQDMDFWHVLPNFQSQIISDPRESEWDTSDSNAEDNPLHKYPDEVSSSEEETEEEEDEDDEDEDEDEDEDGVTCVNGFRELDEFRKTKTLHSSEDEYSYEDGDEEETLADDDEDDD